MITLFICCLHVGITVHKLSYVHLSGLCVEKLAMNKFSRYQKVQKS